MPFAARTRWTVRSYARRQKSGLRKSRLSSGTTGRVCFSINNYNNYTLITRELKFVTYSNQQKWHMINTILVDCFSFQSNPQEEISEELEEAARRIEKGNLVKRVREHLKSGKTSKVTRKFLIFTYGDASGQQWATVNLRCGIKLLQRPQERLRQSTQEY